MKAFFVIVRHRKIHAFVPKYYGGLSVFDTMGDARRRIRTLRRKLSIKSYEFRVLPWHSEMGEMSIKEMWRSALG